MTYTRAGRVSAPLFYYLQDAEPYIAVVSTKFGLGHQSEDGQANWFDDSVERASASR
jgi:hypothetical protein